MFTLEDILEAAARDAMAEYKKFVRDTSKTYVGDIEAIHAYYVEIGWAKILKANGKSEIYSEADRDYWCLVFIAAMLSNLNAQLGCLGEPEIGLNPKLAYYVFASTGRLDDPEKWAKAGFEMPEFVDPKDIRFGDIVCVDTGEGKKYGDHGTYALSSVHPSGTFETIEGNAVGALVDGSIAEGVALKRRHLRIVKNVIRLERKHFIGLDHE